MQKCNLPVALALSPASENIREWWSRSRQLVPAMHRAAWSSLVQLTWWTVWKERNSRIFDHKNSTEEQVLDRIKNDLIDWTLAGKHKVALMIHGPREPD